MPFPFLFLALALTMGIWLSSTFSLPLGPALLVLVAGLACAWLFYALKKNTASFVLLLLATVGLGVGVYSFFDARYEGNPVHRFPQSVYADFYGTLYRSPSPGLDRDYLYLRVEKIVYQNKEERARGNLRVSVPHSTEFPLRLNLTTGDVLKVSAQLIPLREYRNFNEPFSKQYLKNQLLDNLAATKSPLLIEKIRINRAYSLFRWISILRQNFQRIIERNFASPAAPGQMSLEGAVFEALVLGERGRMDPAATQSLQKTGLFHLFALSGGHIAIIFFLMFSLLRLLRVPRRPSYILLIVLLIFYSLLVEGRASFLRATIMSVAFLLGKLFWKDVHLLNTISLSLFFLLLFNPFQFFDLGFQLTFGATLGIILFMPRIMKFLPRLPLKISETFAMSLTAQAGVFPLIAGAFNRIIFSGLALNMIGIPLVGLIMAVGYIFLPISFLSGGLAKLLAMVIAFLIKVFMLSTHLLDGVHFLSYRIPTPPLLVVVGYFLFLLLFLLPSQARKIKWFSGLGFAACFSLLIFYPFSSAVKNFTVTFIDVGQGDSLLVEFPGAKKMLIDGGGLPVGTFDIGESVVSPFLWNKGIKKIDTLVLTHAHPDHLNGLTAVARNFRIGEFWEVGSPPQDEKYADLKKTLLTVPQKRVVEGFVFREGLVTIEALFPKADIPPVFAPDNDRSLVLRISYGTTFFLLPSDIGVNAEQEILAKGAVLESQVLKSPHHGSRSSSSPAFVKSVAPEIVVISVGRGNLYGLPHPDILERYRECGAKIYRTDLDGAIEISSDGRHISVRTASQGQEPFS
jgi:competence protein ComEC